MRDDENMAKDLTAIRIEGESIEQLKRIAREGEGLYYDRSVNWLIGQAVKEFIERHPLEQKLDKDRRDRKTVIATKRRKQ
jgi:hypothetical protein